MVEESSTSPSYEIRSQRIKLERMGRDASLSPRKDTKMFDHKNLVCRLFVAYMLEATHAEYSSEGCMWIVNKFYDEVENFQEYEDCYQRAARRTPLGFSAFFINAERHYELAEQNRRGETGDMLLKAEMVAASTPVSYPIHVRPYTYPDTGRTGYKFFKKLARGKYELIQQYANVIGFSSKAKAEKRARELEDIPEK